MRAVLFVAVVAACGTNDVGGGGGDDVYGTFSATRTITESDPSPQFDVPLTLTITRSADGVTTSTGQTVFIDTETKHSVLFMAGETWRSPEGDGAVNMRYDLEFPGDGTLTGTIQADVIFHTPTSGHNFDYVFEISGAK